MWKAGYAIAELKAQGQQMKFFDTGIAATISARGDKLLVLDSDFDRLKDRIRLLNPPASLRVESKRLIAGHRDAFALP